MTTLTSEMDPNMIWPSMQDLNTRLRRVITSYQRNYKKEELKQQQKAKVGLTTVTCYVLIFIITLGSLLGELFMLFCLESLCHSKRNDYFYPLNFHLEDKSHFMFY